MMRLDPVVTLLTLICIGCGYLLYLDRQIAPGVAADSKRQTAVTPLSGDNQSKETQRSPTIAATDASAALDAGAAIDASAATKDNADPAPEESLPQLDGDSGSMREISVQVSGLKDQPSALYVAVFESATGFPKPENSRSTTTQEVSSETVEFSLSLSGNRSTAIAVFQDLNGDGKLTKNSFGLPVEPYGFSNNARSLLGPPSFSRAAFTMNDEVTSLEIRVR
jgi:uncharacterized protein (DUF2141 family)